jgi:hypothetical protein
MARRSVENRMPDAGLQSILQVNPSLATPLIAASRVPNVTGQERRCGPDIRQRQLAAHTVRFLANGGFFAK